MLGYFAVGLISAILHFADENQAEPSRPGMTRACRGDVVGAPVTRVKRLALGAAAWLCGHGLLWTDCIPGSGGSVDRTGIFQISDHRVLLPAAAWIGAVVALTADLVTHLPLPHHSI